MMSSLAIALLCAAAPPLPTAKPMGGARLFPIDPVAIIDEGARKEGESTREITHGDLRYRFATDAAQKAFAANPTKYALAMSGSCARMGPLSGSCSLERSEVVEGKLYVFASDACCATFLKSPHDYLEPIEAPVKANDEGRTLAKRSRAWMRAERLPPTGVVLTSRRRETENDADAIVRVEHRVGPRLSFGELSAWSESVWWMKADFANPLPSGVKLSNVSAGATLDANQLHALRREAMFEPVFLVSVFGTADAMLRADATHEWTIGDESISGLLLTTHWHGVTVEWLVDEVNGEPLAQRAKQRLKDGRIAVETVRFESWSAINDALVPLTRRSNDSEVKFDAVEVLGSH